MFGSIAWLVKALDLYTRDQWFKSTYFYAGNEVAFNFISGRPAEKSSIETFARVRIPPRALCAEVKSGKCKTQYEKMENRFLKVCHTLSEKKEVCV